MFTISWARWVAGVSVAVAAAACDAGAQSDETARLLAAKHRAYDGNIRNDTLEVSQAVRDLEGLRNSPKLSFSAEYHAAWARWLLSASMALANDSTAAMQTLLLGAANLERALEIRPHDADAHALKAWTLTAITSLDRGQWRELSPTIAVHRRRAVALGHDNPRVMMMDAGMLFYAPTQFGGSQEGGVARWLEAIRKLESERRSDPLEPDWGGAFAYGWLANLYLAMSPPRVAAARAMAEKALQLRPDFWWVSMHVMPRAR